MKLKRLIDDYEECATAGEKLKEFAIAVAIVIVAQVVVLAGIIWLCKIVTY